MGASREYIREHWDVQETPENAGLILTIRVRAYDRPGQHLQVDARPVAVEDD